MGEDAELSSRRWKWIAIIALLMTAGSLVALVTVLVIPNRAARVTDERLIGTWQSDADRTIAHVQEQRPVDDQQEAAFRTLFGKMRVMYTPTTYSTELDGTTQVYRYEVLGKDKYSVAIREVDPKPSPLAEIMEWSEFAVIQFDGPDSYWVYAQLGGIREYFKRVR